MAQTFDANPKAADAPGQRDTPAQGTAADTPAAVPADGTPVMRSKSLPLDSGLPPNIALQLMQQSGSNPLEPLVGNPLKSPFIGGSGDPGLIGGGGNPLPPSVGRGPLVGGPLNPPFIGGGGNPLKPPFDSRILAMSMSQADGGGASKANQTTSRAKDPHHPDRPCHPKGTPPTTDTPPTEPYVVQTTDSQVNLGVSGSVIDLGGGLEMKIEQMSDGTYRVTISASAKAGATTGPDGAYIGGNVGKYVFGFGGQAGISGDVQGMLGAEFTLSSKEELEQFEKWIAYVSAGEKVGEKVGGKVGGKDGGEVGSTLGDIVGGIAGGIAGILAGYKPPQPSALIFGVGSTGDAQAHAGTNGPYGPVTVGGDLSLSNMVCYRIGADGSKTFYCETKISAQAAADLGLIGAAGASGDLDVKVAVTLDASGQITKVELTVEGTGEAMAVAQGLGVPGQAQAAGGGRLTVSIPVTDATRSDVHAVLVGLGLLPQDGTTDVQNALKKLIGDVNASGGAIYWQTLDVSDGPSANLEGGVGAPGFSGGGSIGVSTETTTATGTWYLDPNGNWVKE